MAAAPPPPVRNLASYTDEYGKELGQDMDKWFANGIKVKEKPQEAAFGSKKKALLVVVTGVTIAFLILVIVIAVVAATVTRR